VERNSTCDLSVVLTAFDEGDEVRSTIDSIRHSSKNSPEIHLVDDGSTDGCCSGFAEQDVDVIKHSSRVGVAASRIEAIERTRGAVVAIMDAHQRLELGCLDQCAEVALKHRAIVSPDIRGFDETMTLHGAYFTFDSQRQVFSAQWKKLTPHSSVASISSLKAPLYLIPREVYPKVKWSGSLRGWGGSEASISLKAFFAGVKLLHVCGPLALHKFKKKFHYSVDWPEVWRNHAIVARICFEPRTWFEYWLPEVFESRLSETAMADIESDEVLEDHREFQKIKVRPDRHFWTRLIFSDVPAAVR